MSCQTLTDRPLEDLWRFIEARDGYLDTAERVGRLSDTVASCLAVRSQGRADDVEQAGTIEGFGQEAHPWQINLDIDRAHQDNGYGMTVPAQPVCQSRTIEARHPHIGQHQIDVVRLQCIDRFQTVRCLPHRIALVLEEIRHHFPDGRLVLDDQHRRRCLGTGVGILRGTVHDETLLAN